MRRVGSIIALVLAAAGALLMVSVAYSLTSEYGVPGGLGEAARGVAGSVPGALVVGLLVLVGCPRRFCRFRLALAGGAALAAVLGVALAVLLGDLALRQRCDERGAQHSAACPGRSDRPGGEL